MMPINQAEGLQRFLDKSRDESDLQLFNLLQDVDKKLSAIEAKVCELEGRVESLWNWRSRKQLGTAAEWEG
jgi:hypothetical protein